MGRTGVRRTCAVVLAALVVAFGVAAPAGAHGGTLLGSAVAGPYRVQVTGAPLNEPGKPPAIDVTVYVKDASTGTPVDDAQVRTVVRVEGALIRPAIRRIAGGYEGIVPGTGDARVGEQRIEVDVSGPLGSGRLAIDPVDESGGPPVPLLVATAVVLLGSLVLVVRVRRRGAREPEARKER